MKLVISMAKLIRKDVKFVWIEDCEKNSNELKERLTRASILTIPNGSGGYVVYCDASEDASVQY